MSEMILFMKNRETFLNGLSNGSINYNIGTKVYSDGVVVVINPYSGYPSISKDFGDTWINLIIDLQIKKISRVSGDCFIFDIDNGADPKIVAITYDMFKTYSIIENNGTESGNANIDYINEVTNIPLRVVRNAIYKFNVEEKSYSRVMNELTQSTVMCDSKKDLNKVFIAKQDIVDKIKISMIYEDGIISDLPYFIPQSPDFYDYGIAGMCTVVKDDIEFLIALSKKGFMICVNLETGNIQPNMVFFNTSMIDPHSIDMNKIILKEIDNKVYIFFDTPGLKACCSVYSIKDIDPTEEFTYYSLTADIGIFFSDDLRIRNYFSNEYILDKSSINTIDYVSIVGKNAFISCGNKTIRFNVDNYDNNLFISDDFKCGSIILSIDGEIRLNKDYVHISSPKFSMISVDPKTGFVGFSSNKATSCKRGDFLIVENDDDTKIKSIIENDSISDDSIIIIESDIINRNSEIRRD